jgi:outer membrane receptor protein involved in Fe transport
LLGDLTINYDYQSFGVNWHHLFSNRFSQTQTVSIQNFSEEQQIGTDRNTGEPFYVDVNTTTMRYDPELLWKVKNKHELLFGANFSFIRALVDIYVTARPTEDNTNQTFSSAPKYRIESTVDAITAAPYIKHNWQITPKLKSSVGLRYAKARAKNGVDLSGISPRASLQYQLSKKLLLLGSWGKYLQSPEESTLLKDFGNPGLEFTEAEHRIIGAEYKFNPLWSIKFETYHKPMEKLVLVIPENPPPDNYKNLGEGEAYGFDILIKREYANRTMGWLSYSYARSSRTTVQGQERDFSGDQPHTLNMVWSQPMPGSWKRWTWGIKLTMHSGALHTPIIGRTGKCTENNDYVDCANQTDPESETNFSHWEPIKAKQNSERLPFYYLMSLRVDREIRFNTWKMNVFMDVQNLTFRKNIIGYNYGKKYEKIENRQEAAAFYFPIPLIGVEAEF